MLTSTYSPCYLFYDESGAGGADIGLGWAGLGCGISCLSRVSVVG